MQHSEIQMLSFYDDEDGTEAEDREALLQQRLEEIRQSWVRRPPIMRNEMRIDLRIAGCQQRVVKWAMLLALLTAIVLGILITLLRILPPKRELIPLTPDQYSVALRKALLFFDAQKSGNISGKNNIPWRGDSGLKDGFLSVKGGLIGGYYDGGLNIKCSYPMAFSMTILSWSVIEYGHKYKALGEYDHIRDIIKWGIDYLLKTFDSLASDISVIYSQVGVEQEQLDDAYCWQRPEDVEYDRLVLKTYSAPELGSELAAALASASIVFRDHTTYSMKLVKGAEAVYRFARAPGRNKSYTQGYSWMESFYKSTDYRDEFIWAATWIFFATGKYSYLVSATDPNIAERAKAFTRIRDLRIFSWDNKLPGADLLLTRVRIFLDPGYPYEETLRSCHNTIDRNMCSYLRRFGVFNYTRGGLIQLNHGGPRPLQYVVNAAFLASLYADYMSANKIPGWYCGEQFMSSDFLREFAISQVKYILGTNPMNMSYVVGYGQNFPRHVHHRGASIPNNKVKYSCTGGWKWRDALSPNPNIITGAMVGGPMPADIFIDVRSNGNYTEPTLAANAGLVAALVSLTGSGGMGNDKNTIQLSVASLSDGVPPPPLHWKP